MTIDEAISHALEVAGEQQERADSAELIDILDGLDVEACEQCAADRRQLAEWLTELKELRGLVAASNVLAKDVLAVDTLCKQILEYKRLLKLAVEDLEELHSEADCSCNCCKGEKAESCQFIKCWTWRYADEALKLLGGSENG